MAQVIAFGSLVLDRPLDRDYPAEVHRLERLHLQMMLL